MKKFFTSELKLWKVMQIGAVQLMIITLSCGMAVAHHSNAQLLDKKISMSLQDVPLITVIGQIQQATGTHFSYSIDQLGATQPVSIEVTDEPLREVLELVFLPQHISYKVIEEEMIITLRKTDNAQRTITTSSIIREPDTSNWLAVQGVVTDQLTGHPIAGVNIIIKGTTTGTTTDAEGKFSIEAESSDVLVFSFIGYASIEAAVDAQTIMHIALTEDVKTLNEVVLNAGYWQVSEKEQTGNIVRVSSSQIARQPINNPLQAMQGHMPGVFITQQSGVPGGAFNIQIRGQNSLRNSSADNGNRPLYIIDGVPFTSSPLGTIESGNITEGGNPLSNINPSDIESIEVLKDADATAIYGSRGANGVVLITTKKGKAGKTQFDINVYQGAGKASRSMTLLNTTQYLQMRNEALANDESEAGTYAADDDLLRWDQSRNTNWQKKLLSGTAHLTNAQLSVSGGSSTTRFLISGNLLRETTVFSDEFADTKGSANFKLNHQSANNKFHIDFSGYYLIDNNKLPRVDLTPVALSLPPNAPALYNQDGTLNWEESTWTNPLASLEQKYEARTSSLVNNTVLSYEIIKGLQAKANFGYTEIRFDEFASQPSSSFDPASESSSSASFASRKNTTWISEPQLEYKTPISRGVLTALIGSTFQKNNTYGESFYATGFTSEAQIHNMKSAADISVNAVNEIQYNYNALFGRINYNWDGKYIVNFTGRRDGSSRFGPGKQFANFGAIGAAWIFSEEKFLDLPFLSHGKLRASFGATGSDQIGDYGYVTLWNPTSYPYGGITGLIPGNLSNRNYAWEVNRKAEAGLELGFLEDRLRITTSYYNNRSSNQLVGLSLPRITGFGSVQSNLNAEVQNTGVEISIASENVHTQNITWTTVFNVTLPSSKLISFPGLETSSFATSYIVGKPITTVPSFHALGVDPATGIYQFEDVNGDGLFTSADYRGYKNTAQKFFGGIQNTFTWKGFELDIFFQYVNQTGRNYLSYFNNPPGMQGNQPEDVLSRWTAPGNQTSIQKYTQAYDEPYSAAVRNTDSDAKISDASYIRLRNVALSYNFSSAWINKLALQRARLYVQGQNLLTITDYKGLDPETQNASLPTLRRVIAGIQLTF